MMVPVNVQFSNVTQKCIILSTPSLFVTSFTQKLCTHCHSHSIFSPTGPGAILLSASMNLLVTSQKQDHTTCHFVSGLFHLAQCFQDLPMLKHMFKYYFLKVLVVFIVQILFVHSLPMDTLTGMAKYFQKQKIKMPHSYSYHCIVNSAWCQSTKDKENVPQSHILYCIFIHKEK